MKQSNRAYYKFNCQLLRFSQNFRYLTLYLQGLKNLTQLLHKGSSCVKFIKIRLIVAITDVKMAKVHNYA